MVPELCRAFCPAMEQKGMRGHGPSGPISARKRARYATLRTLTWYGFESERGLEQMLNRQWDRRVANFLVFAEISEEGQVARSARSSAEKNARVLRRFSDVV